MAIYEFIRGYGNSNGVSRNMYEGSYEDSSRDSGSSRGYKLSRLENLGDYQVMGAKPININAPVYSSV